MPPRLTLSWHETERLRRWTLDTLTRAERTGDERLRAQVLDRMGTLREALAGCWFWGRRPPPSSHEQLGRVVAPWVTWRPDASGPPVRTGYPARRRPRGRRKPSGSRRRTRAVMIPGTSATW